MADLQERLKSVIEEIENKIENKDTLEFVKTQIYNLSLIFLDEIDRVSEVNVKKMEDLADKYREINDRVEDIEDTVKHIEKDIYMQEDDEEGEFDLEIVCPYCNNEFMVDFSEELKDEVICPECNNVIELDWNKEDHNCGCCGCDGHSEDGCNGSCDGEHHHHDNDNDNNNEDM